MEELNTALATLIEQATTGIDASVSFLQAELPDVIYQLLMWHGVKSGLFFLLAILLIGVLAVFEAKAFRRAKNNDWREDDWLLLYGLAGCAVRVPLFAFAATFANLTWLQIWIAPKVWLIEYAANLVK